MMGQPIAVFLCDESGVMAEPWAAEGIECFCVDVEHSIRRDRKVGNINFVWGDCRSWRPPEGCRIIFGAAFPPCTHVAVSGARDFIKKGGVMLRDALDTFEACRQALAWSGAPYCVENPRGVLASIPHIGRPQHRFDPCDYAGYADDPASESYTKETCLWVGNGFVMPEARPEIPVLGSKMHLLPPTADRASIRSKTPQGFARAVKIANFTRSMERLAA